MYKQSFGLREAPFSVTPDPKFVFLSFRHRNALGGLTYGILSRKRFIVLTGDVGTGKTTLIAIVRSSPRHTRPRCKDIRCLSTSCGGAMPVRADVD